MYGCNKLECLSLARFYSLAVSYALANWAHSSITRKMKGHNKLECLSLVRLSSLVPSKTLASWAIHQLQGK
jgi:hypothetical protein